MKGWKNWKLLLMVSVMLGWTAVARPEVIITGLLHGTLPGGAPKAIELCVTGTENLGDYEIWRSANGGAFGYGTGSIASLTGEYSNTFVYLVKSDQVGVFVSIWGDSGIYSNVIPMGILTGNGNDGFQIRRKIGSEVVDQVWYENITDSYRDSYWYRKHGTGPDGGWFTSNWDTPGNDALDGLDEAGHRAAVPFGTYSIVWKGLTTDWISGINWSSGLSPSFQTNVMIADTVGFFPEIDNLPEAPAECMNLTILDTALLTVNPGKALTVHGNLSLPGQPSRSSECGLILQSGISPVATGSLIVRGNVSGITRIKKFLPKDNSWRFLSSPVQEQAFRPEFAPELPDQSFDIYSWDESVPLNQGWINIRDENGSWNPSFEDSLTLGKGYLMAYTASYSGDEIRTFSGLINHGDQEIPVLHANNHWNLSGNPYTCALDWSSSGISKEFLSGAAMYIWDPEMNDHLGGYRTHNGTTGVPEGTTSIIPAMQGFFVQSLDTGNIFIDVEVNDPLVHNVQSYIKSLESPREGQIRLKAERGPFTDEILVFFHPQGTGLYDPELDVNKLFAGHGEVPEIYFLADDQHKVCMNAINGIPASVPVCIVCSVTDYITLSAFGFESADPWVGIYLEDRQEDRWINLRYDEYHFLYQPLQSEERFILHLASVASQAEANPDTGFGCFSHDGHIYVRNPESHRGILSVFTLDGRKVNEWQIQPGDQVISAYLSVGIYMVRVFWPHRSETCMIMIK